MKVKAYNKVDSSIEGGVGRVNTMYVDANMASYFKDNPVENPEGVYPHSSWKQAEDGRWWYDNGDGTYPSSNWQEIGGKWYFFDAEGLYGDRLDRLGGASAISAMRAAR